MRGPSIDRIIATGELGRHRSGDSDRRQRSPHAVTAARPREESVVHFLVNGFNVLGVHVQYWMLLLLVLVVGATIVGLRSG
jgi:hypothetical protein